MFLHLTNGHRVLGCSLAFGGSLIRPEATGYGLVYFVDEMLKDKEDTLKVTHSRTHT